MVRRRKYFADNLPEEHKSQETQVLSETKHWLDIYFTGKEPDFFRHCIRWDLYFDSLYGISSCRFPTDRPQPMGLARKQGLSKMSAQAVGGAVGHNEISIIIPCHRVVGTNGSLTGYAGGIAKKIWLLELEHTDMSHLFVPGKRVTESYGLYAASFKSIEQIPPHNAGQLQSPVYTVH